MRFCQYHQLARTRRILVEVQADIVRAARPKPVRNRKFEEWQLAVGDRWAASVEKKTRRTA